VQAESDLRLTIDWPSFYWMPSDIFGPGKVLVFGLVENQDHSPYAGDMRARLKAYTESLYARDGMICNAAHEIEGFLFKGLEAERRYNENGQFEFISTGGYYHSLPGDALRQFIDTSAEAQRAMGFQNEKDHPEVAPSQFEMNFSYQEANHAADQVQLYKLLTRQVAAQMGLTACYLPKPVAGVNGNGMHTNLSLASKDRNLFYEKDGKEGLSPLAWDFVQRVMANAQELCLILNPSVNAYRRLDPHFEAPNQIKVSPTDRGSMIRIPLGNEKSARLEVRSVAPDTNPYLNLYGILRTGLEGPAAEPEEGSKRPRTRFLPDNIQDAIRFFKGSKFLMDALGEDVHAKYAELKVIQAERCPKALGAQVKACEIQYHHEVTNQYLWNQF
jgi:glutamine synthetase